MAKTALVTLAIGRDYSERFERYCRRDWLDYAQRHGFDLVVFEEPLDKGERAQRRSPAWQKCLILSSRETAGYDRIVWADADICINPQAPSILEGVPSERIGVIDEHSFPTASSRMAMLSEIIAAAPDLGGLDKRFWRAWLDPSQWHAYMGLPGGQRHIVQTGVMVLSPRHHRALFEHVYQNYDDGGSNLFNYEMRPLSHEMQLRGLQHWIDARFNALIWWLYLQRSLSPSGALSEAQLPRFVKEAYRDNFFLHFAGAANLMALLSSSPKASPLPARQESP